MEYFRFQAVGRRKISFINIRVTEAVSLSSMSWNDGVDRVTQVIQGLSFPDFPQFEDQSQRGRVNVYYRPSDNSLVGSNIFRFGNRGSDKPPTQEQEDVLRNYLRSVGIRETTQAELGTKGAWIKFHKKNPTATMKVRGDVITLEITRDMSDISLITAKDIISLWQSEKGEYYNRLLRRSPISFSAKPKFKMITERNTFGLRITAPFNSDKTDIEMVKHYLNRTVSDIREASMRRKADGEYKLGPASGMVRGLRYGEEELSDEEIDLMAEFDPNEIGERTEPRSYGHFTQQEYDEISDIFYNPRMASSNVRVYIDEKQLLETAKRRVESQLELILISKKKAKKYSLKEYEKTWLNTKLFNPGNPIPSKIGDMVLKRNSNPHTFYYVQHHIIELVQPLKYEKSDGSAMTFEDRQLIADTLSSMIADDWGTMGSKNLYASMITDLTAEPSVDKGQNVLKLTVKGNRRLNMGSIADFFRQFPNDIFGANVSSVYLEYGRGELSFVGVLGKSASRMAKLDSDLARRFSFTIRNLNKVLNKIELAKKFASKIDTVGESATHLALEKLKEAEEVRLATTQSDIHFLSRAIERFLPSQRMASDEHLADFYKESDVDGNYMSVQNIKEIQDMANFLAQQVHNGENMEDWVEDKISSARQMLSDLTRYYSNGEKEMKGLDNWKFAKKQDSAENGAEGYFADIPYLRETREFAQSGEDTNDPNIDPKAQSKTPPTPSEIEQDDDVKTLGRVKVEEESVKQDKKASATARLLAEWKCLGEE